MTGKVVLGAVVAALVGAVGVASDVGVGFVVAAVVAAVVAFLLLDGAIARSALLATRGPVERPTDGGPERVGVPRAGTPASSPPASRAATRSARLDPAQFVPDSTEIRVESNTPRAFSLRVAKHGSTLAECEDAAIVDAGRRVMAIADGASSSFGAHLWSDTLARHFVARPPSPLSISSFETWIAQARAASPSPTPPADGGDAAGGWWSESGARQGAFSTLIGAGVHLDGERRIVTVMGIGDSSAFILTGPSGGRILRRSVPYEDASQFGSHPALVGSVDGRGLVEPSWTAIGVDIGDVVVLASDAVAEWLLGDVARFALVDGSDPATIVSRLVAERADGRLVNDDLAIVLLDVV